MRRKDLSFCPIKLSYVVPCFLNQENHDSLHELLTKYTTYDSSVIDRIQFVIVDDCSPTPISLPNDIDLNIILLRIETDKPWNQGGARNLGVTYSRSDKVIATDLDHEFPEQTLRHIIESPPQKNKMYKPQRIHWNGSNLSPHPNTFIMSRSRFLKFYGVDEEFSGEYGYEDGFFYRWQRYNGTRFSYMSKKYPIYVRKLDQEHSYHTLERDKTKNKNLLARKKMEISEYGPDGGHSRKYLNFTWKIAEDRQRAHSSWTPPQNHLWKKLFWLRWLKCD